MKKFKIANWISTGLLTALMLFSASMYIVKYDDVSLVFGKLGFPAFIIYPLAIAKILGLVAIWTNKSKSLKEWAYAGFVFDLLLAAGAHISVNDGEFAPALFGIVLVAVSYFTWKKVSSEN